MHSSKKSYNAKISKCISKRGLWWKNLSLSLKDLYACFASFAYIF